MRLWASDEGADALRFRPSPAADGWLRGIVRSGNGWTMIAAYDGAEHRFPCRQAVDGSLPPWFAEALKRNLLTMAKVEERGDPPAVRAGKPEPFVPTGAKILMLLVVIGVLAMILWTRLESLRSNEAQWANMQAATRHLPGLIKLVESEKEFGTIELFSDSSDGGCLLVQGALDTEEQLRKLKDIVSSTHPPVTVRYAVQVSPSEKAWKEKIKRENENGKDPGSK